MLRSRCILLFLLAYNAAQAADNRGKRNDFYRRTAATALQEDYHENHEELLPSAYADAGERIEWLKSTLFPSADTLFLIFNLLIHHR